MTRHNPFDETLEHITRSMTGMSRYLDTLSEGVAPFDSEALTPDEEWQVYQNPAALFRDEVDDQTGLPLTNANAAQRLFEQMGPVEYTRWVERMDKRATVP